MATASAPSSLPRPHGGALLALLAAGALLWLVTNVAPLEWAGPPQTEIVLDGAHYRVGADDAAALESFSLRHFAAGRDEARALAAAEIETRLDAVFDRAERNVPAFLDWYYSLRGEYSRAAATAGALVGLANPEHVGERAASMLLPEDVWSAEIDALESAAAGRLAAQRERVRAAWLTEIAERLESGRVPAPLPSAAGERPAVVLDGLLGEAAARERSAFAARQTIGAGAAAGAAAMAPALARAAAGRGGRAAAARGAARGAARVGAAAGRVGTAAAGGAAVCAAGGPAAAVCAVLAGAGAWLGADWALIRVDEAMHRDDLERSLYAALADLRVRAEAELIGAYDELVAEDYASAEQKIRRTFVPVDAGRARAGAGDEEMVNGRIGE